MILLRLLRVSAQAPHFFVMYDSQFPLASLRFGRDSIQYRVGKTHCQGHQDASKRVPIFPKSGNSEGKLQDSHLLGSHFAESYCTVKS